MINITTQNFNSILSKNKPLVVVFYSDYCNGCEERISLLQDIEREINTNSILFGKCDAQSNVLLANNLHIMSVPAVFIFRNNRIPQQVLPQNYEITRAILSLIGENR